MRAGSRVVGSRLHAVLHCLKSAKEVQSARMIAGRKVYALRGLN